MVRFSRSSLVMIGFLDCLIRIFGNFVVAMYWVRDYGGYGMVTTLFNTLWNMYKAILSLKLMGSCYFGIYIKLCLV